MKLVLYLVTIFLLGAAIFNVEKTENRINYIVNVFLTMVLSQCVITFVGGLLGLFGMPVCCYSICPIVCLIALAMIYHSRNNKQKITYSKEVWLYLGLTITAVLIFWITYYGFRLNLRFVSVDASVHARFAKQIAFEHTISSNLFYSYLSDGLFMEAMTFFTGTEGFYHSFVFMRIVDLFVACLGIYSVFSTCVKNSYQGKLSIIFSFLYMLGYPLYTILFGFVYFGASITVVTAIVVVLIIYHKQCIFESVFYVSLNLLLFGVFTSYTLFVPPVFLSIFIYYIIYNRRDYGVISKQMFLKLITIFAVPCILGMAYAWVNLKEITPGGAVGRDGGRYFDLYSNFVLMMPFILAYFYHQFKQKHFDFVLIFFGISLCFTILLIVASFADIVSIYYMSKMYNIIWLCSFYAVFYMVCTYSKEWKILINTGLMTILFLLGMTVLRIDKKLNETKQYVNVDSASFMNLYAFNGNFYKAQPRISQEAIEMFYKVEGYIEDSYDDSIVTYVGDEITGNWYITFTDQYSIYVGNSIDELKKFVEEKKSSYLCVHKTSVSEELMTSMTEFGTVVDEGSTWEIIQVEYYGK